MMAPTETAMSPSQQIRELPDRPRVTDLRGRVRSAMQAPPAKWDCPACIDPADMAEPIPVRKALAIALKLSEMPTDLWDGQLLAGSMTLESPRLHAEHGFPRYLTEDEIHDGRAKGWNTGCFGHIVPDYPALLQRGLVTIRDEAQAQMAGAETDAQLAFLRSVVIALDGVLDFASRLAAHCDGEAQGHSDSTRAAELRQMAADLRRVPALPALTFRQALQSVWLLHMVFHSTMNGNAIGRLDQYAWPYLQGDLQVGRLDWAAAAELVACFCLKFNERAKATHDQAPEARVPEKRDASRRTRHYTSSQIGTRRDGLDATNHWLQNIVVGGLTPNGDDGTNPLAYLLLEAYRRNEMTNPLLTVRLHKDSPEELLAYSCDVLKDGGGMPALFNDDQIIPALERIGIPAPDARDYTNDGCWEVIIPGRTNFGFQRLSAMLCLEWVLQRVQARIDGAPTGPDTGDPREMTSFQEVFEAWERQLDHMIGCTIDRVARTIDDRSNLAPVPLLSALIAGCIDSRRDMTAGGAAFRTFALLAESAAHCIDSLVAIKTVVFETKAATMADLCDALDADFAGYAHLRSLLEAAPKYGNDDPRADDLGRQVVKAFTEGTARHAARHAASITFSCGVGTFSWYVGIGEGLAASADGRHAGQPVPPNLSPALGRDHLGIPGAILSYARMHDENLSAGGPLDLRLPRRLVHGTKGAERMTAILRSFVETGGNMMTLTVADTGELKAAQGDPESHGSLRIRMGGWSAFFTMLSREQQDHQIRRQGG